NPRTRDRFHKSTPVEWTLERPTLARVINAGAEAPTICAAAALGQLPPERAMVRKTPRLVSARVGKDRAFGGEGDTPLGIAARHGRRGVVMFLLSSGGAGTTEPST